MVDPFAARDARNPTEKLTPDSSATRLPMFAYLSSAPSLPPAQHSATPSISSGSSISCLNVGFFLNRRKSNRATYTGMEYCSVIAFAEVVRPRAVRYSRLVNATPSPPISVLLVSFSLKPFLTQANMSTATIERTPALDRVFQSRFLLSTPEKLQLMPLSATRSEPFSLGFILRG